MNKFPDGDIVLDGVNRYPFLAFENLGTPCPVWQHGEIVRYEQYIYRLMRNVDARKLSIVGLASLSLCGYRLDVQDLDLTKVSGTEQAPAKAPIGRTSGDR